MLLVIIPSVIVNLKLLEKWIKKLFVSITTKIHKNGDELAMPLRYKTAAIIAKNNLLKNIK